MPAYFEDVRVRKAAIRRTLVTLPFLVAMIFSLLPIGMYGISWLQGKMVWHKEEAEVTMVPSEDSVYFSYEKDKVPYSGTLLRPKLLFFIPYGGTYQEGDTISIAYQSEDPAAYVVFAQQECNMLTWVIIFAIAAVIYFVLDSKMKKAANIRLAG